MHRAAGTDAAESETAPMAVAMSNRRSTLCHRTGDVIGNVVLSDAGTCASTRRDIRAIARWGR